MSRWADFLPSPPDSPLPRMGEDLLRSLGREEGRRERVLGSLLVVCTDCREMVLQVITMS